MDTGEILTRIKIIHVKKHGGSIRDWAAVLGIPQPTLDKKLRGEQKLSLELVMRILETYPEISADWLLKGEEGAVNTDGVNNGLSESKMALLCDSQSKDMEWLRKKINKQAEELSDITELLEQKNKLIESLTKG